MIAPAAALALGLVPARGEPRLAMMVEVQSARQIPISQRAAVNVIRAIFRTGAVAARWIRLVQNQSLSRRWNQSPSHPLHAQKIQAVFPQTVSAMWVLFPVLAGCLACLKRVAAIRCAMTNVFSPVMEFAKMAVKGRLSNYVSLVQIARIVEQETPWAVAERFAQILVFIHRTTFAMMVDPIHLFLYVIWAQIATTVALARLGEAEVQTDLNVLRLVPIPMMEIAMMEVKTRILASVISVQIVSTVVCVTLLVGAWTTLARRP